MLMSFESTPQALQGGSSEHGASFQCGDMVCFFVAFHLLGCVCVFVCVLNYSKGCIPASNHKLLSS